MKGAAFCPAHVTGFFKAQLGDQNLKTSELGSLGAGFSIQDGVTTQVEVSPAEEFDYKITTDGYATDNTIVSEFVINDFIKRTNSKYFIKVHHEISVPVGYGLGSSGAVALSLAVALNKALSLNLSKEEVGEIAHNAEVMCKTGLGDVLASYHGGFEIRIKAGAPGVGVVEKIDSDSNVVLICFSPISTKKFITEKIETINGLGGKMVDELRKTRDYKDFQDMSIKFSKYIQVMTPKMESVVADLHKEGIRCGVALFGETVFTMIPPNMEQKVLDVLKKYDGGIIIKSRIDNSGVRLE